MFLAVCDPVTKVLLCAAIQLTHFPPSMIKTGSWSNLEANITLNIQWFCMCNTIRIHSSIEYLHTYMKNKNYWNKIKILSTEFYSALFKGQKARETFIYWLQSHAFYLDVQRPTVTVSSKYIVYLVEMGFFNVLREEFSG